MEWASAGIAATTSKEEARGEGLKALRLPGRYLGYIRQLRPRQRAEVKAVRKKKGVEAAIKRARRLVGR